MLRTIIKKCLNRYQRTQAQKDLNHKQLNNRIQRYLIIKGLEERGL